jgi:hypothetical protein
VELANEKEIKDSKYPMWIFSQIIAKILRIHNIGYSKSSLNTNKKYLEGFWQSYKYLDPIRKTLLEEITLKNPIEDKYRELLNQVDNTNSVSIHIRRGDYINNPKTKWAHYTFGIEYYEQAIKKIKEKIQNPTFFVFSDDMKWVKENLKTNSPTIYIQKPTVVKEDEEEMMIMSRCKNNIIANSSFSFWGAWLNQNPNKIVIAPEKWNNRYQKEYKDLLPSDWIKI